MLLLLIIIKCWMLSFIVCSFFDILYLVQEKKKLLYFALLWTASHGAFLNLLLCQLTLFLSYLLFLPRGKTSSRQSSLLDID